MKILYLANLRLPTEKAYGIQIAKTCEAMASLGNEVLLLCPYRINKIKKDFFDFYSIKKNFKFKRIWMLDFYLPGKLDRISVNLKNFCSALILCIYVLTQKIDRVYTRDEWPAYVLSFFKKSVAFEIHKIYSGKKFFLKRLKNKTNKIIAITNGLKSDLVALGFREENILVAPDGVDLDKFDIPMSQKEAREELDLPLDKKIIVYNGHLFEWKGAGVLLEAARQSLKVSEFQSTLFVFVGGTEHDIKEFKKKAEGLDNVYILGHKPHSEIPTYLKAADVLVLPNSGKEEISSKYTSPLKLFEYMASRRPIVASDLLSLRDVLNEENCFFAKPDDLGDLVRVIQKVLQNSNLAEEVSNKALEDVKNYTWQKRAEKILNFIK